MTKHTKCFFVGMHNKPGMDPLDSRTRTGKVVDAIIAQLDFTGIKTNLFDDTRMPEIEEIPELTERWLNKYTPSKNDIIVLLGSWVKNHLRLRGHKTIFLGHPAGIFGPANRLEYIEKSIAKIKAI